MDEFPRSPGQICRNRNNLDKCFDSILENELHFQIEEKELMFIKEAIETLVRKLIQAIDTKGRKEKFNVIDQFIRNHEGFRFIYNGKEENKTILCVGSFYEKTKNCFPDEFDYIYVIRTLEVLEDMEEFEWRKHYFTLNDFHDTIKEILTRVKETEKYVYSLGDAEGPLIYFDGYNRTQGPSSKLTFKYEHNANQRSLVKTLNVDIVPAFRIIDKRLPQRIRRVCNVSGFAEEIAMMGRYLITNEVSFTETESQFMSKLLSPSHKRTYRLLKYILNGCNDGEKLRNWVPKAGISTYMIKVATIHHYYQCNYQNTADIKPSKCVITILKDILQYCKDYENNRVPLLKKFHGGEFEMQRDNVEQTIDNIENMLTQFELLQSNRQMAYTVRSISASVLNDIKMKSTTSNISGSCLSNQSIYKSKSNCTSFCSKCHSMTLDTTMQNISVDDNAVFKMASSPTDWSSISQNRHSRILDTPMQNTGVDNDDDFEIASSPTDRSASSQNKRPGCCCILL